MEKTQVSVLLCVYNPDKRELAQAVESIIRQTFTEWEMILYDDGSDNVHKEYIYEVSILDRRIRYVRNNRHQSLAHGLNESMKLARGKYLARMDADDISHPRRFEKQVLFLEKHTQVMWVGSNISLIDENGNRWGERRYPKSPGKKEFLKFSPYAHPSIIIRREALLAYGGYNIDKHPYRSEDYELFMRLHAAGEQGANLQEFLLDYRESEEAYKKRMFICGVQEAWVRWEGFQRLGILNPCTFIYVIKPIIVWLIPDKWIYAIKRR